MGFDRVARIYRLLERVMYGGALQRARVAQLDHAGTAPRVLLLGDGDGRFLEALLARVPNAEVVVVESSAAMIRSATKRVPDGADVVFHQSQVESFEPEGRFDLVASHFFLDCFDRSGIGQVVALVHGCLEEGGRWLIADFQMPEHGWWRRGRASFLLWAMYGFFRLAAGLQVSRLIDPDPILKEHGFALENREVSNFGFVRSDCWGCCRPAG